MTVGEVLEWQKRIRPRVTSTAAGRYQIIHKTLTRIVDSYGIDPDLLFDAAMQDHLGELLLAECGYRQRDSTAFADCLAQVWAALPRVTGPKQGRSAWHGTAGNRALVTPEAVLDFLGDASAQPSPGDFAASVTADLPRASFEYSAIRGAIEREIRSAHENDTLRPFRRGPHGGGPVPDSVMRPPQLRVLSARPARSISRPVPLTIALLGLIRRRKGTDPSPFRDRTGMAHCGSVAGPCSGSGTWAAAQHH